MELMVLLLKQKIKIIINYMPLKYKIQNTIGLFGNGNISRFELIMNEINVLQHIPKNKYFPSFIEYYDDNIKNKLYIVSELVINYVSFDNYIKKYKYNQNDMFNISRQLCESVYLLQLLFLFIAISAVYSPNSSIAFFIISLYFEDWSISFY